MYSVWALHTHSHKWMNNDSTGYILWNEEAEIVHALVYMAIIIKS